MFNAMYSRILFRITDLLALALIWFGVPIAAYGYWESVPVELIKGIYMASGGLSLLIATHIGKALVHIAETIGAKA